MKFNLPVLILFTITCCFSTVLGQDETKCIETTTELEENILASDENKQSLIRSFYPANRFPALWITVLYYINESNNASFKHPIFDISEGRSVPYQANYTFYWGISPVLTVFQPGTLKRLSLYVFNIDNAVRTSHLVISPFCRDRISNETILHVINEVTQWIKSYAINGGIDPGLQGYTAYKPHRDSNTIQAVGTTEAIDENEALLWSTALLFVIFTQVMAYIYLYKGYGSLQSMTKLGLKRTDQHFRFKSFFWAVITQAALVIAVVIGINIFSFVDSIRISNNAGIAMFCGLVISIAVNSTIAVIITVRMYKRNEMMDIPKLFLCVPLLKRQSFVKMYTCVFQLIAIVSILLSAPLFSFHGFVIVIAALTNPSQVFTVIIFSVALFIAVLSIITFIYEGYERGLMRAVDVAVCLILAMIFVAFFVSFMNIYFRLLLFVNIANSDIIGLVSQVFPVLLLAVAGKFAKMELVNYFGKDVLSGESDTDDGEKVYVFKSHDDKDDTSSQRAIAMTEDNV